MPGVSMQDQQTQKQAMPRFMMQRLTAGRLRRRRGDLPLHFSAPAPAAEPIGPRFDRDWLSEGSHRDIRRLRRGILLARRQARRARWLAASAFAAMLLLIAAAGLISRQTLHKLTAGAVQVERMNNQLRAQQELAGSLLEERDMLRADLIEAREARARAEGALAATSRGS